MGADDELNNPAPPEGVRKARHREGDNGGRDGRGRVDRDEKGVPCDDPLLAALIKEHPERDPANMK